MPVEELTLDQFAQAVNQQNAPVAPQGQIASYSLDEFNALAAQVSEEWNRRQAQRKAELGGLRITKDRAASVDSIVDTAAKPRPQLTPQGEQALMDRMLAGGEFSGENYPKMVSQQVPVERQRAFIQRAARHQEFQDQFNAQIDSGPTVQVGDTTVPLLPGSFGRRAKIKLRRAMQDIGDSLDWLLTAQDPQGEIARQQAVQAQALAIIRSQHQFGAKHWWEVPEDMTLAATQMAPDLAIGIGLSAIDPVLGVGYWWTRAANGIQNDLVSGGVDPKIARITAQITAVPSALLMGKTTEVVTGKYWDGLVPLVEKFQSALARRVAAYLAKVGEAIGLITIQGAVEEIAKGTTFAATGNKPIPDAVKDAFNAIKDRTVEAAKGMPLLVLIGGAPENALKGRGRPTEARGETPEATRPETPTATTEPARQAETGPITLDREGARRLVVENPDAAEKIARSEHASRSLFRDAVPGAERAPKQAREDFRDHVRAELLLDRPAQAIASRAQSPLSDAEVARLIDTDPRAMDQIAAAEKPSRKLFRDVGLGEFLPESLNYSQAQRDALAERVRAHQFGKMYREDARAAEIDAVMRGEGPFPSPRGLPDDKLGPISTAPATDKAFRKYFPGVESTRRERSIYSDAARQELFDRITGIVNKKPAARVGSENAQTPETAPVVPAEAARPGNEVANRPVAPTETPRTPTSERIAKASEKARAELGDALDELGTYLRNRTFSNPLDPELIKLAGKAIGHAVKAGAYTFADVVNELANRVGSELTRRVGPILTDEWNKVRKSNKKLEEAGNVEEILAARPGRPKLANPATSPGGREGMRDVDMARAAAGRPEVVHEADTRQRALQRFQADPQGERSRVLEIAKSGGTFNTDDVATAMYVVSSEWDKALREGTVDSIKEVMQLAEAYREIRSEQGRALRIAYDRVETPAERNKRWIGEAILMPAEKIRDKINAIKANPRLTAEKKGELIAKLYGQAAKEAEQIRKTMEAAGLDLSKIDEIITGDFVSDAKWVKVAATAKADAFDKAYEWFVSAILSGPITQSRNVTGNLTGMGLHFTVHAFASALGRSLGINPGGRYWGELTQFVHGILPGLSDGARNALITLRTEMPYWEMTIGGEGPTKLEHHSIAIAGKKGRAIRGMMTSLMAADEGMKTVSARMEVGAIAYHLGRDKGIDPKSPKMAEFIHDQMSDLSSDSWTMAAKEAQHLAFQEELGKFGQKIIELRRDYRGLKFFIPFVTTIGNLFKWGTEMTIPLGTIKLAREIANARKTGDWAKVDRVGAHQVVGAIIFLALLTNDEKDPWITGTTPLNPRDRATGYRTYPPHHFFTRWGAFDYGGIEPLATAFEIMTDAVMAFKKDGAAAAILETGASYIRQMKDKTMLKGMSDLMQIVNSDSLAKGFGRWASGFAASWVPNLFRTASRASQDTIKEREVWGKGWDWADLLATRTAQKTELLSAFWKDYPKVDLWGREIVRPGGPQGAHAATDFAWRFVSPVEMPKNDVLAPDRMIYNWNATHDDTQEYRPIVPSPRYVLKGKTQYMTPEQYHDFLKTSGERAYKRVMRMFEIGRFNVEKPTEPMLKLMGRILSQERDAARKKIIHDRLLAERATP